MSEKSSPVNKEKRITIILEESTHAQEYQSANMASGKTTLIHQEEFDNVINIIKKNVPQSIEREKRNLHNTITILGSRGSGKTSFLLSVRQVLTSMTEYNNDIQVLEIIDPTLIEEKGHVFLNVIALISDLVNKRLDDDEINSANNRYQPLSERKEWRSALNQLAHGLPSIDGIGAETKDAWQDPEFVMDTGLKAVHASQKLSENFNQFLKISLGILKKKTFLLLFDDIDVDAAKGWAVLESIRKYFTSNLLLTIISGDLGLYSTLVRQRKWQNFGEEILKFEGKELGRLGTFNNMITQLESQYLQKVLQPQYRIHLPTIGERIQSEAQVKFFIYKDKDYNHSPENEIKKVYHKILGNFGIHSKYQSDAYTSFLLSLPLRSQIQLLSTFDLESGEFERRPSYLSERAGPIQITDIFLSDLYSKGIDTNIAIKNPKGLNRIILNLLIKEKKLEELYQLQPTTSDFSLNSTLTSLSLLSSHNIQTDAFLIFDYLIKIGYTRNLVPLLGYEEESNDELTPSIEDLCNNTAILNDKSLKDVAGKITAYIRATIDKNRRNSETVSQAGTIPLFGEAAKAKKNPGHIKGRIDTVLKDAKITEKMLIELPYTINKYSYKNSSLLTYSPYVLLGAIGEMIRRVKISIDEGIDDTKSSLAELSMVRTFVMTDFLRGNRKDNIEEDEEEEELNNSTEANSEIEDLLIKWIRNYPSGIKVSIHVLGKVATRFFYATSNLEKSVGSKRLGGIFRAQVVAFMNAVLVEDCAENTDFFSELNLSNPNYSNSIFLFNLNKVNRRLSNSAAEPTQHKTVEQLRLSRWILSCPLLVVYLTEEKYKNDNGNEIQTESRKTGDIKQALLKFCGQSEINDIFNQDLGTLLDKIYVKIDNDLSQPSSQP